MDIVKIGEILNKFVDFLFPEYCYLCNSLLLYPEKVICKKCLDKSKKDYIKEDNIIFGKVFYINSYKRFSNILIESKIQLRKSVLEYYLNQIKNIYSIHLGKIEQNIDLIIPVPLYSKKYKERGFNQSYIIAKTLFSKDKINKMILTKDKKTKQQKNLNVDDRKMNLKNAFKVNNKDFIINKNILIVDDVTTTGSTLIEVANVLLENSCNSIKAFTLFKA